MPTRPWPTRQRFVKESQAYANSIIPVAQGAAARMQQDAEAYKSQVTAIAEGQAARFLAREQAYSQAPEVTRKRMYMDTVENVLARAHKVFIDTKAGNGWREATCCICRSTNCWIRPMRGKIAARRPLSRSEMTAAPFPRRNRNRIP